MLRNQTTTTTTSVSVSPKNMVVAYVLWFFLGQLGVHRFYLGKIGGGVGQLVLAILGYATVGFFGFGFLFLGILWLWLIIDLFLIPDLSHATGMATQTQTTTILGDAAAIAPVDAASGVIPTAQSHPEGEDSAQ